MVEVDGLKIGYERSGDGPPLVLLHGYVGDGPTTWRRLIDEFNDEFAVVATHGWSARRSSLVTSSTVGPPKRSLEADRSTAPRTPIVAADRVDARAWPELTRSRTTARFAKVLAWLIRTRRDAWRN
jgi:pimeloyl-ACP methyl ester carboxylesterase